MKEHILILTQDIDPHADQMVDALEKRGIRPSRFHTRDFPIRASIEINAEDGREPHGVIRHYDEVLDTRRVKSVWYRRPAKSELAEGLSEVERAVARAESEETLEALYRVTDCLWVNRPERNRYANSKITQLRKAKEVGFRVPRTLITNSPARLIEFFNECRGNVIVKMQRSAFWSVDTGTALYTSKVGRAQLEQAQLLQRAPCMFQEYVPKALELRVTVIGSRVFAVAIRSQDRDDAKVDWRKVTSKLKHEAYALPAQVESQLLRVTRGFGLQYGAIDLIVTPEGEFVFLEINPNGQFGWIEAMTGIPLYDAMADLLISGKEE